MPNGSAFVYIFDGFADWEPASALAELRRTFGFSVHALAQTKNPVVSMGGLRIVPDQLLAEGDPAKIDIAILPGGDAWMRGEIPEVTRFVKAVASAGRPVAAICAATLALAHAGQLDDRRHTSNGAGFISKFVPRYRGQHLYQKERALTDRNIITANGLAPFAFASQIFRAVAPHRAQEIAVYDRLYSRGMLDD